MKKLFKNRYFSFLMIYLCILCIFGAGLSLSQYTTNDTATDDSGVAVYNVVITAGESMDNSAEVSMSVYATSKISEPNSMIDGTYEKMQINVTNRSECTISLSDFLLDDNTDSSVYQKIIIPMNKTELEAYEKKCGSVPLMILNYLGLTQTQAAAMGIDDVSSAVSSKNTETCAELASNSDNIAIGESKTFFVISWVEHDSVYKNDADNSTDNISHNTPTELGIQPETFKVSVDSEQVD